MKAKAEGLRRRLVGFEMVERGIPRSGFPVEVDGRPVGQVTSGSYAPTLDRNLGLAYVEAPLAVVDRRIDVVTVSGPWRPDRQTAVLSVAASFGGRVTSVGIDAVEVARIGAVYAKFGERFLRRVYTDREADRYRGRINELAARFAAKEAVSKALGTGLHGISWRDIEVLPDPRGKPLVFLHDRASRRARELGLREFAISLSHPRSRDGVRGRQLGHE